MLPIVTALGSPRRPASSVCQLVVPCRPSMRFLSIGSQVSPSLPSPSWLQMVVSSFSCLVFLQGTCTPFTSRPRSSHTKRCTQSRFRCRSFGIGENMKPSRFSSSLQKILNGDSQLRITFSHGDILVLAECEEVDPSIYDEKGRWCCDIVEAVF